MSVDENKALARRFLQVWAPGNLSLLDELAAPEIMVIYPVLGEPVRGAVAFKQLLAHFHAACPDVEISVQEQIAEGDIVVTRWRVKGTHRGELLGISPTGRSLAWTGITIHRLVGGRVVEERGEEDALGLMRQIGVHMSSDETRVLVRRLEEAVNARRLDVLDELVSPDFVRHCQATPQFDVRGLEQFKEFLRLDATVFPDNTTSFTHVLAEGDLAAAWGTYEATQAGQMGPFPPSGKKVRVDLGAILRVENGKIAELWITWDNMAVLGQLGHLTAVPAAAV
jgi:steroid delta-isomerase-like uncharacterized protein